MFDSNIFQRRVSTCKPGVEHHKRAEDRPTDRRSDCIFRTVHFATHAKKTIIPPSQSFVAISPNVLAWALSNAEIFSDTRKLVNRETALIMWLLMRGPQTLGELRGRCERAYKFVDLAEVESTLEDLIESGYVTRLEKMAGRKESRYAHLLAGEVEQEAELPRPEKAAIIVQAENERITDLEEELQKLREDFTALQSDFSKFKKEFE